ncbi:MAG: hypothetical protein KIS67_20250 [Verrucomicrobiae bacterium]|nr:hypothetical protein [Verrucomicrobiae bacterium]
MPTLILKKTSPLEGVVAGEKATLDLPIGPRYNKVILEATVKPDAAAVAGLDDICGLIKLQIDGKTQREATATEMVALYERYGAEYGLETENLDNPGNPLAAGDKARFRFTMFFAEPWRKEYAADKVMSLPTRWANGQALRTLQIEIAVPDTTGATLHNIVAYASVDGVLGSVDANGAPILNLSKWYRETIIYTASGDRHLVNLPKRDLYQELDFFTQSGDPISNVKIKVDGAEILDVPKVVNDLDLVYHGINRAAISDDRFDVIFDRDDLPNSAFNMNGVRELEVIITLSNAAAANKAISLIRQTYGPRD